MLVTLEEQNFEIIMDFDKCGFKITIGERACTLQIYLCKVEKSKHRIFCHGYAFMYMFMH